MAESKSLTLLSTGKKDEAAFYLSELARGLLKDHVALRMRDTWEIRSAFDSMQVDLHALENCRNCTLAIRLSWRASRPGEIP
jgi:hypothetical protein